MDLKKKLSKNELEKITRIKKKVKLLLNNSC